MDVLAKQQAKFCSFMFTGVGLDQGDDEAMALN